MKKSTKTKVKNMLKTWVMLELVIAGLIAVHLGPEGLAAQFCKYLHVDRCDQVEWTE
jgi:hypothetical protein